MAEDKGVVHGQLASYAATRRHVSPPLRLQITWLYYMGDEGGILCKLDLGLDIEDEAFVSITHLRFDARLPLARAITAYQKHRVKRLQRQRA